MISVMPFEAVCRSEAQTKTLAAGLARLLKPGDIVFLTGQLGSGKTFFIKAAARALGVREPVTSPSFTMANSYSGNVTVHHLDIYRLKEFGPAAAFDFEPFFEDDCITFVEWPEVAESALETPAVRIHMDHVDEQTRRLSFKVSENLSKGVERLIDSLGD